MQIDPSLARKGPATIFPFAPLPAGRQSRAGCVEVTKALRGDRGMPTALLAPDVFSGHESLPADRCQEILRIMVRTRAMEERMIKMSKSGQGHFWIGGPGEEAFNTCLGLQVRKGEGP